MTRGRWKKTLGRVGLIAAALSTVVAGATVPLPLVVEGVVVPLAACFGLLVCSEWMYESSLRRYRRPTVWDLEPYVYANRAAAQAQAAHMRARGWLEARVGELRGWIIRVGCYRTLRTDGHVR